VLERRRGRRAIGPSLDTHPIQVLCRAASASATTIFSSKGGQATLAEPPSQLLSPTPKKKKKPSKFAGLMAGDDSILEPGAFNRWPSVQFPPPVPEAFNRQQSLPAVRTVTLPDDPCPTTLLPDMHHQRKLHYVQSMLSRQDVAAVRDKLHAITLSKTFQARDTQCVVIVEDGEPQGGIPGEEKEEEDVLLDDLVETVMPMLHEKTLPQAQAICDHNHHNPHDRHPKLVIADALIRSYDDPTTTTTEKAPMNPRNTLAPHYDQTSYGSVIIPLNDPTFEEIQGGLYIQTGASITSRHSIDFERVGDGLLHMYDVMHGVHVEKGNRLSLVVWLRLEDNDACGDMEPLPNYHYDDIDGATAAPLWLERDQRQSVHAAFLIGMHAQEINADELAAQTHWEWAAERGHALSQYCLSILLTKHQKLTDANPRAANLLIRAAGDGHGGLASAQYNLGIAYKNGHLGLERNENLAKMYFQWAAQQGCRPSHEILNDPSRWH